MGNALTMRKIIGMDSNALAIDMTQNPDDLHIRITPENAMMLDAISRRHGKPPETLIDTAIRAMYASIPPTERNRIERKQKRP
jgi:hypothetical protein